MNPLTSEWVAKAEGDFNTAQRESAVQVAPNYDAVCFHAQQCVEKYLKARLTEAGIAFPRTHDLVALLSLLLPLEDSWADVRPALEALTSQAVEVRYPGTSADRQDAEEAVESARRMRAAVRSALGLT
jgi:HEPN domain-containing protein